MEEPQKSKLKGQLTLYLSREPQRLVFNKVLGKSFEGKERSRQVGSKPRANLSLQHRSIDVDTASPKSSKMVRFSVDSKAYLFEKPYQTLQNQDSSKAFPSIKSSSNGPIYQSLRSTAHTSHLSKLSAPATLPATADQSPAKMKYLSPEQERILKERQIMDETREVLRELKKRNCKENIKMYKQELSQIKFQQNPYNATISLSGIEQQLATLVPKTNNQEDKVQNQYRQLREYLRLYKQRLYLVPKHQVFEEDQDSKGLDYNRYKELKGARRDIKEVVRAQEYQQSKLVQSLGLGQAIDHSLPYKEAGQRLGKNNSRVLITDKQIENAFKNPLTSSLVSLGAVSNDQTSGATGTKSMYGKASQEDLEMKRETDKIQRSYYAQTPKRRTGMSNQSVSFKGSSDRRSSRASLSQSLYQKAFISGNQGRHQANNSSVSGNQTYSQSKRTMDSLDSIYQTCTKLRTSGRQLEQRFERNYKDYKKTLSNCHYFIEDSLKQRAFQHDDLEGNETPSQMIDSVEVVIQ